MHKKSQNILIPACLLIMVIINLAISQTTGSIEGNIVEKRSGEPLPGVNIVIIGTVLGTTSDVNGHYIIHNVPPGNYDLRITMMGYKKIEEKGISVQPGQSAKRDFGLEETVIETPELVVTANKRRQSIQDTPTSVGVITQRDFRQKNEIYLDKLLQYAPGVNFIGSQINIRGSSGFNYGAGSRVLMTIDGVPVMPGDAGDLKWDIIPATQIERVEIIKGAGSALYGSSALGGVVNIITKEASAKPVTNVRLSAGIYDNPRFAAWDWTSRTLHFDDIDTDHSRRIGKVNMFAALGRHQSTGYAQNGHYQRLNGSLKLTTQLTNLQKITLSSNFEGGRRGTALMWRSQRKALEANPEALGDYVNSDKVTVNGFHQWILRKNLGLKTRFSYFRNYWKNIFHDNITATTANRYGLEIQGDYQFSENNSFIFGTEETFDHVNSGLVGMHDQYVLSLYLQNERQLVSNLLLTLGLRHDFQHVDTGFEDSETSPKAGLVWHAQSNLTFRASSGKGFRAASMSERFADGLYSGLRIIPNVDLKSETAWSHEIGANYSPASSFFLDVALFASDYWDLIEPEPDSTQTVQFINITRARISGIETNAKFAPMKGLFLDVGYAFMEPQDFELDQTLAYRAKHLFTGGVSYRFGSVEIGWNYRYVSRLDAVKVYPQDDRVAQKVADARMGYYFSHLNLSLHGYNIFNHNHTQQERTLLPIRRYVATLTAAF